MAAYRSAGAFGSRDAAPSQAAVGGRPTAAAYNLELLLGPVSSVQELFDELLETHLGIGFAGGRLLQELVDLDHLPPRGDKKQNPREMVIGRRVGIYVAPSVCKGQSG